MGDLIASILADMQNESPLVATFSDTTPIFMQGPSGPLQELLLPMQSDLSYESSNSYTCLKLVLILVLIYLICTCLKKSKNNSSSYIPHDDNNNINNKTSNNNSYNPYNSLVGIDLDNTY